MSTLSEAMTGKLSYNGFKFPAAVHAKVRSTPQPDATGRVTKSVRHQIQVETILYPGVDEQEIEEGAEEEAEPYIPFFGSALETVDGTVEVEGELTVSDGMEELRRRLMAQGKKLEFSGKGFGHDFELNTKLQDVEYGPKPKMLTWDPIGSNKAVRIVWMVEVVVSNCDFQYDGRITEMNYQATYSIDDHGMTARTVSGRLEIAQRIDDLGQIQQLVDQHREKIRVVVPLGFQRRSQEFNLSADHRFLQFRIVDRELASQPYHKGIVKADVTHDISNVGAHVSGNFLVSISGSFSVAAGFDKGLAWQAFLYVVKSKRDAALRYGRLEKGEGQAYRHAFPVRLAVTDEVFGRGMRFRMAWLVLSTFQSMPRAAGLFASIDGASWPEYRAAMLKRTWGVRGHAQLRPQVMSTRVQRGCGQDAIPAYEDTGGVIDVASVGKMFSAECPPKNSSYVSFCPTVTLLTNTRTVPMYSMDGVGMPSADMSSTTFHQTGTQKYQVRFRGVATRVGYPVHEPKLISYGGAKAVRRVFSEEFEQREIGMSEGCTIYWSRWDQIWELDSQPAHSKLVTFPDHSKIPCLPD